MILPTLILASGLTLSTVLVVRYWREPADHRFYKMPPWWLWGETLWRALGRARVAILLVAGAYLSVISPLDPRIVLGLVLAGATLALTLAVLSWPSILVPPALRKSRNGNEP